MNVFCDYHHSGLLQSFILLFEHRFGGMVYRPIGRAWYDRGFWHVYPHPATVEQFLGIGGNTPDGSRRLNDVIDVGPPGVYKCFDIDSETSNRAITFEQFCAMKFDYIIATLPQHIEPFKKLVKLHQPQAKLIFQIGNSWTIEAGLAPNVMASAIINDVPPHINFVSYHQEFDTNIFRPQITTQNQIISSLINAYSHQPHFARDWQLFLALEKLMPDWRWQSFGGSGRDGVANGNKQVAQTIAGSRFVWHVKNGGDGYGHIIHNAYAMGVPPIVKISYYTGKMAGKLMVDGQTCINIDGLEPAAIVAKIKHFNESTRYEIMRQNVYNVFKSGVNFDADAKNIQNFLIKSH